MNYISHKVIKPMHQNLRNTPQRRIEEKCIECASDMGIDVRDCPHAECPLFNHRLPISRIFNIERTNRAIRKACTLCKRGVSNRVDARTNFGCPLHLFRKGVRDNE